jgi:hypothetical protein
MGVLITNEELVALLGIEPVLANTRTPSRRTIRRRSEIIRSQYRRVSAESAPTLSLRDIISSEEIAALLTLFAIEPMELVAVKVRKTKTHKRSQARIPRRR